MNPSEKPKKYLILTSSGGGGHIAAAEAKKQELLKRGIPGTQIEIIDLMGQSPKAHNGPKDGKDGIPWIPTWKIGNNEIFSGKANTKKWDEMQTKGGIESVRELESLVDKQYLAETIQYQSVYSNMRKYLMNNDVQEIYDTQALSTPAICEAITEANKEQGTSLKVTKIVTEFLTPRAVHFLTPLSKVKKSHREVLEVQVVEPPLLEPGQSKEQFLEQHGVGDIKFNFLSEKGVEPPVRTEFKDSDFTKDKKIYIKAIPDKEAKDNQKKEEEFIKKSLGSNTQYDEQKREFTINKGDNDKLAFITMGSQGSTTILNYVDQFIDQALNAKTPLNGNYYLCIAAGKNEGDNSLYAKLIKHIEQRKAELENQGKKLPEAIKIIPLAFQDGKHMASLMQNSDILISRSGGMSSIEAKYTSKKAPNRKVYVHSEEKITNQSNFPTHNYDAMYEGLLSGTVRWEGGNAEYLMKEIGASLGSPETVNFGFDSTLSLNHENSLFHLAYKGGLKKENIAKIVNLFMEGSNPNLQLPGGSYIIDHCQDFETMKILVENGAILTPRSLKATFLTVTEISNLTKTQSRYERDFKKNLIEIDKAFKTAIKENNLRVLNGLLYRFNNLNNQEINTEGSNWLSPLQWAIVNDKIDIAKALIKSGCDINHSNKFGTALHTAVANNNVKMVTLLLENGANPHIKSGDKRAYDLIKKEDGLEILKEFIKFGALHPQKDQLPNVNNFKILDFENLMFIKENQYGNTLIHQAVYFKSLGDAKFKEAFPGKNFEEILDENIHELNKMNTDGLTPLGICNNDELRKILVLRGADPSKLGNNVSNTERSNLTDIYNEYNILLYKTHIVILEAFDKAYKNNNKEEFVNSIVNKITMLNNNANIVKDEAQQAIKMACSEAYDNLAKEKSATEKMTWIEKLIDGIKKILGNHDRFTEFVRSQSNIQEKVFESSAKRDVVGEFTKKHQELSSQRGILVK